jgi:hypothetical protein
MEGSPGRNLLLCLRRGRQMDLQARSAEEDRRSAEGVRLRAWAARRRRDGRRGAEGVRLRVGAARKETGQGARKETGCTGMTPSRECITVQSCGAKFCWRGQTSQVNAERYCFAIPIPNSRGGIGGQQCQFQFRGSNVYFQTQPTIFAAPRPPPRRTHSPSRC